ncbi:hypothetical protein TNCV_672971 [Trichonephila clavipes]|nr:hypothetical protein TNCV_672971 [Trichonephila clavipes]
MPLRRFRRQDEQLSQFERRKLISMMEARCLGEGDLGLRRPLRVCPRRPPIDASVWVVPRTKKVDCREMEQIVFSDESKFNLSCDYNRVRV